MFRIRFHGRGGQGIKTAGRVLGSAFFHEGFEVQDAPRYGAERRGAPIFAYVRASRTAINERGIIREPDLVVVADDTLVAVPAAGVLAGVGAGCALLIATAERAETWRERLNLDANALLLALDPGADLARAQVGVRLAAVAARLVGVIGRVAVESALRAELASLDPTQLAANLAQALESFDASAAHAGKVVERVHGPAPQAAGARWIDLAPEVADVSAPAIHAAATSVAVRTGLWRTLRPVIDSERCRGCWWVCSTFCPDGAITVDGGGHPVIDYQHCKGCMVCVSQCPPHAIEAIPEAHFAEVS